MTFPSTEHKFLPLFICVPRWLGLSSVETTDIWNADSEVTETKLTQPGTHELCGGKQPSPLLTPHRCLVLLWCFSVGVSHLYVNGSCTPAWWWWVARDRLGWACSLTSDLGVASSWNQGSCVTGSGTFHLRKGKNEIGLVCGSTVTGMGRLLAPHQKTQLCPCLVSHWLNLRAKNAEKLWKLPGRMKPPEEKRATFRIWLRCEDPALREIFAVVLLIKLAEQISSY